VAAKTLWRAWRWRGIAQLVAFISTCRGVLCYPVTGDDGGVADVKKGDD